MWRAKQLERAAISNSLTLARTSFRECTRQALGYRMLQLLALPIGSMNAAALRAALQAIART